MPNRLGRFGFHYEGFLLSGRRTRPVGRLPTCVPTVDTSVSSAPLHTLPSSRRDAVRKNVGGDNILINFVSKNLFRCGRYGTEGAEGKYKRRQRI